MEEDGERDPLIPPDEDKDEDEDEDEDDDEENTTQPFQPGGHSTPGPSGEEIPMTTFNRGREREAPNLLKYLSQRELIQE